MNRRLESSAETRQRMVEATAALHYERGVSATSLRDIAERAGVSVGTAYHHFPTYDDAIRACGHYTQQIHPLPDSSIFARSESRQDRIEAFVEAMGAFYARCPWIEGIRAERDRYAPIAEGIGALEGAMERLARLALHEERAAVPRAAAKADTKRAQGVARTLDSARERDAAALTALLALTDAAVFRILRERGMPLEQACLTVAAAVLNALPSTTGSHDGRRRRPSQPRRTS